MSDTSQSVAETVTSHDDIVVRRKLSRKSGGIVGTLRIQSTSETPATVHVVDEFPSTLPIDMVGFRRGAEPESGDITPQRAMVTQPVADDPVKIEYGLKLSEEVSDIEFNAPTIRDVVTTEGEGSPHPYTDGGERSSASVESTSESDGFSSSLSSIIPRLGGGRSGTDDSAAPLPQEPAGTETEPTGVEASSDAIERAIEQVDDGLEEDAREPTDAATNSADPDDVDGAVDLNGLDANGSAQSSSDADSTGGGEATAETPRSVDLRIDRLRARVEEFATYATTLEDLIDEHGTGANITDRVDDLDARVASLRKELETVNDHNGDTLEALQERADSLEEQVETTENSLTADVDDLRTHVYDEIARLDTELANQGAKFDGVRTDIDTLDDRVTRVEEEIQGDREIVLEVQAEFATLSDDVEAMRGELEKHRTEVSELAEGHESLADMFDPPTGDEIAGDD